jgi:alkanesulfonate monooxygenase SsuD/methylene tetrahydromethanopterin reductase-like flavin-dependent oxidoreductase (luciferase family)
MKISIGLPATIPGTPGQIILDWARKADAGPFAGLGVLDRIVYPNFEPLVTLAAVAAVTQRIRLMTTVLIAPLREAGLFAKQTASVDALSGGRLTLGLGVGTRDDDFRAAPADFHNRGKRFDDMLALMHRVWNGQPASDDVGPIGPPPAQSGGPEILIGGYSPAALQRLSKWGAGYIAGGSDPATAERLYKTAQETWKAAGRTGTPRFVGAFYYALGPNAARGADYLRHYYAFMGPTAEAIGSHLANTPEAVKAQIAAFAAAGVDELVAWPCVAELDQIDRLAELAP